MIKLATLFNGDMPRLAMFDLDGTLVDSVQDLATAADEMMRQLGRSEPGVDKVRRWVGNGTEVLVRRVLADGFDTEGLSADEVQKAHRLFMVAYTRSNGQACAVYPGVLEALEAFKARQIPCVLVTNKPEDFARPLLPQMGLESYFDYLVGGDSLARKKPDPMPLEWVMERYSLSPLESLMVGDSRNDIQAGKAAGCPVVAVSYGYNHGGRVADDHPDLIVNSLAELFTE